MKPSAASQVGRAGGQLLAAAMVAREGNYAVRVVTRTDCARELEAREAAERAGVDVVVKHTAHGVTIYFAARHQDRWLDPSGFDARELRPLVRKSARPNLRIQARPPDPTLPSSVDLLAFRRASDALDLKPGDLDAMLIWERLLRARARAHLCGGVPTLVVNDVGGLVGLLRRRARDRGAAVRINPEACACG